MVLLESITLGEGRLSGSTERGKRVEISGLPRPEAIAGKSRYEKNMGKEADMAMEEAMEDLKMNARIDIERYYFINEEGEHFEDKSIFVIPYLTFLI